MKKILLASVFILSLFFTYAQNELDALRFSQSYWYGTARTMAMGSAFSALGPDLSMAAVNPAGLGVYKVSEISLTSVFSSNTVTSEFAGNKKQDFNYRFNFNNIGCAFVLDENWVIGGTYNRLNNFSYNAVIEGVNTKGSMIEYFTDDAQGKSPETLDPFSTFLAYDTYLIDVEDTINLTYTNPIRAYFGDNPEYGETQKMRIQQKGGMGQFDFFGAYNLDDILYIGASIGIVSVNYYRYSVYTESNFPDSTELESFNFNVYNRVNGSGINAKFGVLFTPVKYVRIAAAVHSPTFLSLTDNYHTSMDSHWLTPDSFGYYDYESESTNNYFDYTVTTPWRITAGAGFLVGKVLALDFDYDYMDYRLIRMRSDTYLFDAENQAISDNFTAVHNLRGGAEVHLGQFYIRGGYAFYSNPQTKYAKFPTTMYSGGFGIKTNDLFFDFAFRHTAYSEEFYLYNGYSDEPVPQLDFVKTNFVFTFGVKLH